MGVKSCNMLYIKSMIWNENNYVKCKVYIYFSKFYNYI